MCVLKFPKVNPFFRIKWGKKYGRMYSVENNSFDCRTVTLILTNKKKMSLLILRRWENKNSLWQKHKIESRRKILNISLFSSFFINEIPLFTASSKGEQKTSLKMFTSYNLNWNFYILNKFSLNLFHITVNFLFLLTIHISAHLNKVDVRQLWCINKNLRGDNLKG